MIKSPAYFVYILLGIYGSYGTGISIDPHQRFLDHKNGKGGKYTRSHKPIKIVYMEKVNSKSEALKREKFLKSGKGREFLNKYK